MSQPISTYPFSLRNVVSQFAVVSPTFNTAVSLEPALIRKFVLPSVNQSFHALYSVGGITLPRTIHPDIIEITRHLHISSTIELISSPTIVGEKFVDVGFCPKSLHTSPFIYQKVIVEVIKGLFVPV